MFLNVPNLRFRYFLNPWIKTKLGDVCNFYKGSILSKSNLSENGRACILYGQLYTTYKSETIKHVISKTDCNDKNLFVGKSNDVIIPASGETPEDISTACCVLSDGILFGGDLNVLRTLHNGTFLSYQLNGKRKYDIAKLAVGKSIVHLHNDQLKNLCCYFPYDIKEEKVIASFMDTIEERIENQNKIIEDLSTLRKGIIDSFFKSAISSTRLNNYLRERKTYSEKDEGYEHVTLSKEGICPKTDRYDRDFLVKSDEKKYKITKLNDICYNPANLKFRVICLNDYGSAIFSPIYVTFEVINIDPYYLSLYLTSESFIKRILKYQQGTVYERMAVSPDDLCKGSIPDKNKKEINGLINVVAALDKKIKNERKVQDKLNIQKSYLLKNLFI